MVDCIHPNGKILKIIHEGDRSNNYETLYERVPCGCKNKNISNNNIISNNISNSTIIKYKCMRCNSVMEIPKQADLDYLLYEGKWITCASACQNPIELICRSRSYPGTSKLYCSWRCKVHTNKY